MTVRRVSTSIGRTPARLAVAFAALWLAASGACARGHDERQPNDASAGSARPAETSSSDTRATAASSARAETPPSDTPPSDVARDFAVTPMMDQPCTPDGGAIAADSAGNAARDSAATLPLVVGLTLSHSWMPPKSEPEQYDHECLTQITGVDDARISFSMSCPAGPDGKEVTNGTRTICRADLREGRLFRTMFGGRFPEVQAGTTSDLLSRRAFHELKATGATWWRFVETRYERGGAAPRADGRKPFYYVTDWVGRLERTGTATLSTIVNDRTIELPVLLARSELRRTPNDGMRDNGNVQMQMAVLDDERLPLVLELTSPNLGAHARFTKITYPSHTGIERELADARRAVVYGIYFAYNSAELRPESEPVLQEIAGVLAKNPEWRLRVEGHTDSIGGDAFNRELSTRRANAVRQALVARLGVSDARLGSAGYGASVPKEPNDTPEGRAKNRRVELSRE